MKRRGKITVSASVAKLDIQDALRLEVSDNGVGMDEEKVKSLLGAMDEKASRDDGANRRRGLNRVGVRSVRDRIALLFGPPYSLDIASYPGEGTSVVMFIPIERPLWMAYR